MTEQKKIIDADALDKLIAWLDENHECIYGTEHNDTKFVKLEPLVKKLWELATPAPAPQESILDADGWRTDFENIPKYNNRISEHVLIYSQKYNEMFVDWVIFEDGKLSKNQNFNHGSHWRPLPNIPTGTKNHNDLLYAHDKDVVNNPQESIFDVDKLLKWVTAQEQFEGRTTVDIADLKEVITNWRHA